MDNMNSNSEMWEDDDDLQDYKAGIMEGFGSAIIQGIGKGASIGGEIGAIFGLRKVGAVVGGGFGAVCGFIKGLLCGW